MRFLKLASGHSHPRASSRDIRIEMPRLQYPFPGRWRCFGAPPAISGDLILAEIHGEAGIQVVRRKYLHVINWITDVIVIVCQYTHLGFNNVADSL